MFDNQYCCVKYVPKIQKTTYGSVPIFGKQVLVTCSTSGLMSSVTIAIKPSPSIVPSSSI